jgi:hypothetical protein
MESVKLYSWAFIIKDGVVEDSFILGYDQGRPETWGRSWQVNI